MHFILEINESESPRAAFVGWTPVKCKLTIEGQPANSTIPIKINTGDEGLGGKLSIYISNATSSMPLETITHDLQVDEELIFYVAGKFGHASAAMKDTFLLISSDNSDLKVEKRRIMVRVRKNANSLTGEEIKRFLNSFVSLNIEPPVSEYKGNHTATPSKLLHEIILMHTFEAAYEIHSRESFHPWHRVYLLHLERELQKVDPFVTVPYWKFDEAADNVFTQKFVGRTKESKDRDSGADGKMRPVFDQDNPLYCYKDHTIWGPLRRAYRFTNPANGKPNERIQNQATIIGFSDTFVNWCNFEERRSHNPAHNSFTGHVVDIGKDPVDPLFFMMHSNVDRLWALWQKVYNRFDSGDTNTYPVQSQYQGERGDKWADNNREKFKINDGYYQVDSSDLGNFIEDNLWPWDMDNELSRPWRKWYSGEYGCGNVPQIKIPFPDSLTSNYSQDPPTVKSTIDYQGRIDNDIIMGFDYYDIPYFDHDQHQVPRTPFATIEVKNGIFLNNSLPIPDRLEAAEHVVLHGSENERLGLNILLDQDEDDEIRIYAAGLVDERAERFLDIALDIIPNETESLRLRSDLIHRMLDAKRSSRHYASRKPRFLNTLRGLLRSEHLELREQAIEILSSYEDDEVQEFLTDVINDRENVISKPDAIFYLRQNSKNQHAKLFRNLVAEDEDIEVRRAAVEGLDTDPDSIEFLKELVLNRDESPRVREASALSLHHQNPEMMNDLAAQIIMETKPSSRSSLESFSSDPEEENFKAGLLNMLTYTADISKLKQNDSLRSTLTNASSRSSGEQASTETAGVMTAIPSGDGQDIVKQMAEGLLARLDGDIDE